MKSLNKLAKLSSNYALGKLLFQNDFKMARVSTFSRTQFRPRETKEKNDFNTAVLFRLIFFPDIKMAVYKDLYSLLRDV